MCVCHEGSVCTEGCERGLHHDGCVNRGKCECGMLLVYDPQSRRLLHQGTACADFKRREGGSER